MKKNVGFYLFLLLTVMLITNVYAGNYKTESNLISPELKAKLESKLLEAQLGTEYFVIVPPNDLTVGNYMCEIYIGAREPCAVHIEQPNGIGMIEVLQIIKPYSIVKKSLPRDWEIRGKDEEPEDLALKVWSDKPIMVYLGSHASATAEGYMALPVNALGTRYVHCSWKSNQESASNDRYHTGFIVGATQSGTKVQVKLRGKNLSSASGCVTDGGAHKIGSTFTLPVMDEWQVINVWDELMEVSNTRGKCDFTGSTITSNKPIAMFSIHERTDIPLAANNRDNLVEQLLPVNMWGKKHISLQLRCTGATPKPVGDEILDPDLKVGDYFRVVAAEASTNLNVKWWHTKTGELIKELKNQKLDAEGSFWEWNENISQPRQAGILSVQGVALFESDKPVQVMQYCFSTGYGQTGGNFDPLMVIVPPIEQYGYETIMQTSSYSAMNEHYINIIAEGNASDPITNEETLGKVTISKNGGNYAKLIEKDESILKNNVPGTDYYFSGLTVSGSTTYAIKSKTKVAATVFGFGNVISYGWPASMALVETSEKDTLFPQIHQVSGCVPTIDNIPVGGAEDRGNKKGKYHFFTYFADTTNYPAPDQFADPQVDLGISYAPRLVIPDDLKEEEKELLDNLSVSKYYYFIPAKAPSTNWDSREPIKYGAVEFNVEDIYKDALGFASYTDRAGNETIDTLIYIADKVEWHIDSKEVDMVDFGSKTVGGVYTTILKLKNVSEKEIHIKELFLSGNEPMYTLTKGTTGLPVTLGPGEEHEIEVTYQPTSGGTAFDVITLYTDCLQFTLNVIGGSGIARIEVSDIDFGRILVGTKTKANQGGNIVALTITNNGTEDLRITSYHFDPPQDSINGPFFYEALPVGSEPTPENPWVIAKNGGTKTNIRQIMFLPSAKIPYETRLYFESNAAGTDLDPNRKEYAIIKGEGIQPGPQITSYDWGERRVKTVNKATVRLTNSGNTSLTISRIANDLDNWNTNAAGALVSPDGSYKVLNVASYEGKVVYPEDGDEDPKYIDIDVEYEPQSEYEPYGSSPTMVRFYVNFEKNSGVKDNTVYSVLEGKGILPKISVSGYKFPLTEKDEVCEEEGTVIIRNTSETSRLYIKSISFADGNYQISDYTLTPSLNSHDNTYIDKNDSIVYKVIFKPLSTNPVSRVAKILVENDAKEGPEEHPIITRDTLLEGTTFDIGFDNSHIDYGTVTRCIDTISQFVIYNNSTTNDLVVDSIIVDRLSEYSGAFELANVTLPITIRPESSKNIQVRFVASKTNEIGDISTEAEIYTNMGNSKAEIKARPLIIPVNLSLTEIRNRIAGEIIAMPVTITMGTNDAFYTYNHANITHVEFVVNINPNTARISSVTGENGWNFTIADSDYRTGKIKVVGTGNPLIGDGKLCNINTIVLSSDTKEVPLELSDISFDTRDNCISSTNEPGLITYEICADNLRSIVIGDNDYALLPVTPNPFKGNDLTINYSLGLDGDVIINIYNAAGELVREVVNASEVSGQYSKNVNVSDLGSGTYIITMKSGPYETRQQLIIVK